MLDPTAVVVDSNFVPMMWVLHRGAESAGAGAAGCWLLAAGCRVLVANDWTPAKLSFDPAALDNYITLQPQYTDIMGFNEPGE